MKKSQLNALNCLVAARTLLSDKKNWTQGGYARDSVGSLIPPQHPCAACWCAAGALMAVGAPDSVADRAAIALLDNGFDVPGTNDSEGYKATLRMFDETIGALEAA